MFLKKVSLLLFLVALSTTQLLSQNKNDFALNWKNVDSLEKRGLTKSALTQVLEIYNLAKRANNEAQQIKSVMYQIKYRNMVQEDSRENNIFFIDTLIEKSNAPVKNILQNMQAELFWQYLQRNRYKFYNRTKLATEKGKDISTWSLDKITETIGSLYQQSLTGEKLLQNTKIENFDPILIKGENTRQLRPTLFDFLAFRALDYFRNDERYLTKPAYEFTINDPAAFAPAAEFAKASFLTKDTASLQYKAILLLQTILQFHLKDKNTEALLDADFIRLHYVEQHAINQNKSELYEAALKNIESSYANQPAAAQAMYLRAQIYFGRGQSFSATNSYQYEVKRAKELAELAVKKFPKTEGGINAQNLINQILLPELNLQTEKVNVPQQAFRTLVTYKNAKTIYLRVIKTTKAAVAKLVNRDKDNLWDSILALKPLKAWNVALPDPQDFKNHSTEIKIDALENGVYYILSSLNKDFSLKENLLSKQVIYVSNISCIHNNTNDYYVLNRDNGEPIKNAAVQVWYNKYNYKTGRSDLFKGKNYTSNKDGLFKLNESGENETDVNQNCNFQIKTRNDELFLEEDNYIYAYEKYNSIEYKTPVTFLFTDRSLYRPGQTIYFKGIVLNQSNKANNSAILPLYNTTVELRDVNNQKVSNLKMLTNEYGSYHGSFKLPEGGLNGQFSLSPGGSGHSTYFNVEEYKRPKFFVEIKKPNDTYRLMDSIKITGTAKAYAGNTIDGAKVSYRVVRKVRYPIWWGWGGSHSYGRSTYPTGNNNEVEIANGVTITDAKGEFTTSFKALPDESVDKKSQPVFNYEVSADITDINGETRSSNTSVAVAYQMLQLEIKVPEKLSLDSLKSILIRSSNLNNIEEKSTAEITIQQLKSPAKIFRERFWSVPDQFVMSRDEYYNNFPYDVYKDENEVNNYEPGEKVYVKIDSTNQNLTLLNVPLKAGWYKITASTKDKYGEEVLAEKYIELYNSKKNESINKPIEFKADKENYEPGDKINYTISTGFENIWLIHTLGKIDNLSATNYLNISTNKPYQNTINIQDTDRGGMGVSYVFVQHNRVYDGNENYNISWNNKDLNIEYSSFRDKLLPGSSEKWKAKISGNKGEKVAAEILVSMYDASLDKFKPNGWETFNIWPKFGSSISWSAFGFYEVGSDNNYLIGNKGQRLPHKYYDQFLQFQTYYREEQLYDVVVTGMGQAKVKRNQSDNTKDAASGLINQSKFTSPKIVMDEVIKTDNKMQADTALSPEKANDGLTKPQPQIRKNFNETAFFFPDLKTDTSGNVEFSFTMPEALTQWKLMTFAHTKNLASGYSEKTTVTQKPLMVQANAPRFLREGDGLELSAKIVNFSDKEITGTTQLELFDAATNKPVDGWFKNVFFTQYFTVAAGQSAAVKFPMEIPFNYNSALTYRITAKSSNKTTTENFSDGEEMSIPILTNRMLVTESLPINLHNEANKSFTFEKLVKSGNSQTLTSQALTVEFTANPAWYAVQALPYLMEYPYECAEQTFNRYYANTLAGSISNSMPKIKTVFDKWLTLDTAALLSNLQKNEELKSSLLQETPWVLNAQNESKQKRNIALLFNMVKMAGETDKAITKLKDMQSNNGGFVWFRGGREDRYITQYILTGIGHLIKLKAIAANNENQLNDIMGIVNKVLPYLDKQIKADYDNLLKYNIDLKKNNLSSTAIQYLYMRSFFTQNPIAANAQTAHDYYLGQSKKYWLSNSKYLQAMIALSLNRTKDAITPTAIIKSLKENAINNEELGMYWKEFTNGGYYWYEAPIESQALMIEAFADIDKNTNTINDLKTWLLKQKQTKNWKTTKATADACYALLLNGTNDLAVEREVTIQLGKTIIKSSDETTEAGTGYFKKTFKALDINAEMGNIKVATTIMNPSAVKQKNSGTAWGAVYWQYFEDLDKITFASTPLKLTKSLFIQKNTDKGPELIALADGSTLKVGDKVKVRITLKADREMEYLHMKDMRAACMEPTNVISQYKYQDDLGYYESTLDASTNFFFDHLKRGSYVFEYDLFVTTPGNFSNGITTIQCMYAPEFTSHSDGIRVTVDAK